MSQCLYKLIQDIVIYCGISLKGVSWFVTADELKQDARKENEPQSEATQAASKAWFEPYTRSQPWKEPLREPLRERHLQPERKKPNEPKAQAETDSCKPSALVRLSLQVCFRIVFVMFNNSIIAVL